MKYMVGGNSSRNGNKFSTLFLIKKGVSQEDGTPYIYIDTKTRHYEEGTLPFGSIVNYGRVADDSDWVDSPASNGKAAKGGLTPSTTFNDPATTTKS